MNTTNLRAEGLIAKSLFVEGKMTDNANYPTPNPSIAVLTAARQALESANAAAADGGHSAHLAKRMAVATLKGLLRDLAGHVTSVSSGDETMIVSSGFDVRKRTEAIGKLSAAGDLVARFTNFHGEVDLNWNVVRGAHLYQVYVNALDPADEGKWEMSGITTKSRHLVSGLETGKFYWFRVQAVGTAGYSPMSDIAKSLAA